MATWPTGLPIDIYTTVKFLAECTCCWAGTMVFQVKVSWGGWTKGSVMMAKVGGVT